MSTMHLTIVTPEKTWFDGPADSVRLKTDLGRMEVLPEHATLLGTTVFTKLYVKHGNAEEKFIIRQGVVRVNEERNVHVFAMDAEQESQMSIESMEDYLHYLKEQLAHPDKYSDYQKKFFEEQRHALEQHVDERKNGSEEL